MTSPGSIAIANAAVPLTPGGASSTTPPQNRQYSTEYVDEIEITTPCYDQRWNSNHFIADGSDATIVTVSNAGAQGIPGLSSYAAERVTSVEWLPHGWNLEIILKLLNLICFHFSEVK